MWEQAAKLRVLVSESEGRPCAFSCWVCRLCFWSLSDSPGGTAQSSRGRGWAWGCAGGGGGGAVSSLVTPGQRPFEMRLAPWGSGPESPRGDQPASNEFFYLMESVYLNLRRHLSHAKAQLNTYVSYTAESTEHMARTRLARARAAPPSQGAPAPPWEVSDFFLCICVFLAVLSLSRPHSAKPASEWGQEEAWAIAGSGPGQAHPGASWSDSLRREVSFVRGWHLHPVPFCAVPSASATWAAAAQSHQPGGGAAATAFLAFAEKSIPSPSAH